MKYQMMKIKKKKKKQKLKIKFQKEAQKITLISTDITDIKTKNSKMFMEEEDDDAVKKDVVDEIEEVKDLDTNTIKKINNINENIVIISKQLGLIWSNLILNNQLHL